LNASEQNLLLSLFQRDFVFVEPTSRLPRRTSSGSQIIHDRVNEHLHGFFLNAEPTDGTSSILQVSRRMAAFKLAA